jgi:hypothetical protein
MLVPVNTQLPAHLQNRKSALANAIAANLGGESLPRISIKGGRFRAIEDGTETVLPTTFLKAVIVGANPALT